MENTIPRIQIGVMGGAFKYTTEAISAAYKVGKIIAEKDCTLVTGATTGIPHAAALGASKHGGFVVGISPASNAKEHSERYKKPLYGLNAIVYTGMGYNGREPINVATCDGIIYIGGEFGTLIEFGQGFYEGKVLGVLTGVGGISDKIAGLLKHMGSSYGSKIIYESEPEKLVCEVLRAVEASQNSAKHIHKYKHEFGSDVRKILEVTV